MPDETSNSGPEKTGEANSALSHACRLIVEHAPEVLALIGPEGSVTYVNSHVTSVLGYVPSTVTGHNIFDYIHPEDAARAALEFSDTIQNEGERPPSVLRLKNSSGQWVPFEVVASNQLQNPKIKAVIFSARDLQFRKDIESAIRASNDDTEKHILDRVTELARTNSVLRIENQRRIDAESDLRRSVSVLHATLDSTADGILVVSTEGKVVTCNKRFIEMWNISCTSPIGVDDERLLAIVADQITSPNEFLVKVRALYEDPLATSFDELHLRDGRIFERYSQPQRLNSDVIGRVWSFRDVTRARQLELELRQSQKMEALGRLAGGVAHDFNNLLMLISGYSTQLLENPATEDVRSISDEILQLTKRAASVTKQLLAFSRKLPDVPTVVDLNATVLSLESMLRRLLSDQIALQISVTATPEPVFIDASQIEIAILNLAINAQDAMPEGGTLSIITSNTDRTSEVGKPAESFAVLEVSDTGHGMNAETKARAFEPFFTTKQLGKGTGLGLSTVFGIVERSGGRIEVDSEPSKGSTFRIFLPHSVAAYDITQMREAEDVPSTAAGAYRGKETILLAEDEGGIRAMTRAYLESLGYHVLEARDGAEAVLLAKDYSGTIDAVVTDMLMPGIRGDSAINQIRNSRPNIKALIMSGYTDQDFPLEMGEVLYKPFEFPELGRRLRELLDHYRISQDAAD